MGRRTRRLSKGPVALVAVAVVATAIVGCGGSSSDSGSSSDGGLPEEVTIGMLDSMTGNAAFCGQDEENGATIAIEQAEREKLLGSTKVKLQVEDDKTAPEPAVLGFQRLAGDNVAAIVGPCVAEETAAVSPLVEREQIPMVITTSGDSDTSPSYIFRAGIPQPVYVNKTIDYIAGTGVKNVAVIYDKAADSIGKPIWEDKQKPAIEKSGMKIVSEQAVSTDTTNFTSQVSELVRSNPDAIGILLRGAPNLTVVKQLRESGYDGPIWGQTGMNADYYVKDGGDPVQGTVLAVSYSPSLTSATSKAFTKAYRAKYQKDPSELAAHGYDATLMVLTALKEANSADHAALQKQLASMKTLDAAQGKLTFTPDGDARGAGVVVAVKDGKLVPAPGQ